MKFISVSKHKPCTICEKDTWCSINEDSSVIICRRQSGGKHKIGSDGCDYWVYTSSKQDSLNSSEVISNSNIASIEERHSVYNHLLEALNLTSSDYQNLNSEREISKSEIELRQYKSLPRKGREAIAKKIVQKFGEPLCRKIPGLYFNSKKNTWSLSGYSGLLIPSRNNEGLIQGLKIRTDGEIRYMWFSSSSKGGSKADNAVHYPIFQNKNTETIRITEGELKADIATIYSQILTLSIPGVQSWKKIVPELVKLNPQHIKVAFDMDLYENEHVKRCLFKLCQFLMNNNKSFEVEKWKI